MEPYDIASIYHQMEIDLIASQRRTLALHEAWERAEGFEWEQWQTRKLAAIRQYQKANADIIAKYTGQVNEATQDLLTKTFREKARSIEGIFGKTSETGLLVGIPGLEDRNFFGVNQGKLNALIRSIVGDFARAEYSALRLMDDQYRKTIYRAQSYFATGSTTLYQAVDLASNDFLAQGIRCIEYSNGNQVNIASYAEMALRTQQARTSAIAQGAVMDDWGHHLIIMAALGSTCEMCLPWQGRVLIDDVYATGTQAEGSYPLLSTAISQGLGHPNCRHLPGSPWFEGINTLPELPKADRVREQYDAEVRQREIERNIRKYKRLEAGSLDPDNQEKYAGKVKEWQARMKEHLADNPQIRRMSVRESASFSVIVPPKSPASPWEATNFASETRLARHVRDHLTRDYPGLSADGYVQRARDLLNSSIGGPIAGFTNENGFVFRYNVLENDFATGKPDGTIETLFKPKRKAAYWEDQINKHSKKRGFDEKV